MKREFQSREPNYSEQDFEDAAAQNDRRRVYYRRPKRVLDLVNTIITRRGIAAEQSNHELQNTWDSIVGIELANQTRVASVRRGVLEVIVGNSSALQWVRFHKDDLKVQLNQKQRGSEIKDLRFRIGNIG